MVDVIGQLIRDRSKVSTCIVEYVGQYCESKSVCCLSVDVVDVVDESMSRFKLYGNKTFCSRYFHII